MAKDRLLFLLSFAFIGLIAALLFSRPAPPPPPPPHPPAEQKGINSTIPSKEEKAKLVEAKKPDQLPAAPGKIASSLLLISRSSIVQFINLGQLVDIIFTSKSDIGFGSVTLTLLHDIRVLGIGVNSEGKIDLPKPNTPIEILLELTPKQAEILSYAQESGVVTLGIEGNKPISEHKDVLAKLIESESTENFQSALSTYMISRLFPKSHLKIIATAKGYIVSGKAADQQTAEKVVEILSTLANEGGKAVVNLMEIREKPIEVLAAKSKLKSHTHLQASDYDWIKIPPSELNPSLIVRDSQSEKWLNDFFVARDMAKGEMITRNDLIWPQEVQEKKPEGLPLAPGKTAVPLPLPPNSPILPLIRPGDYVDLRFTSSPEVGLSPVSLILLSNVRVLSIGKGHPEAIPMAKGGIAPAPKGGIQKLLPHPHPLAPPASELELVLEMTPRQAEILSFAQPAGVLTPELPEWDRSHKYDDLTETLLASESPGDFRSILITYMIRSLFPNVCIKVTATPRGFIVEGKVPDPQLADKILETLARLVPGADRAIINLLDVEPQQVMLAVRIYEVAKGLVSRVGLNWSVLFQNNHESFLFGAVYPQASPPNYVLNASGVFGNYTLSALIDMLEEDNYSRVLAEPNLTTISGETAHFFAGGEFPILIPQGGNLIGTVIVMFKKFGVLLDFTPFVDLNGLITLHVVPEVSRLDKQNAVVLSGFIIPSLITRRVDTKVKLWPGQSYIIAGLYLDELVNRNDNLYGLNRLPVVGALFGSNNLEEDRTELLVVVTPYLIRNNTEGSSTADSPPCVETCNSFQTNWKEGENEYNYSLSAWTDSTTNGYREATSILNTDATREAAYSIYSQTNDVNNYQLNANGDYYSPDLQTNWGEQGQAYFNAASAEQPSRYDCDRSYYQMNADYSSYQSNWTDGRDAGFSSQTSWREPENADSYSEDLSQQSGYYAYPPSYYQTSEQTNAADYPAPYQADWTDGGQAAFSSARPSLQSNGNGSQDAYNYATGNGGEGIYNNYTPASRTNSTDSVYNYPANREAEGSAYHYYQPGGGGGENRRIHYYPERVGLGNINVDPYYQPSQLEGTDVSNYAQPKWREGGSDYSYTQSGWVQEGKTYNYISPIGNDNIDTYNYPQPGQVENLDVYHYPNTGEAAGGNIYKYPPSNWIKTYQVSDYPKGGIFETVDPHNYPQAGGVEDSNASSYSNE